jgi:hypothetical protein
MKGHSVIILIEGITNAIALGEQDFVSKQKRVFSVECMTVDIVPVSNVM